MSFGCRPWNFSEPFRNASRRSQCGGHSGHGSRSRSTRASARAGVRWANASSRHIELDSCDLPTARGGVPAGREESRRASQLHSVAGGSDRDPSNCRHARSNGSSGAMTVWSQGAGRSRGTKGMGWAQGGAPGNNPALRLRGTKEAVLRSLPRSGMH